MTHRQPHVPVSYADILARVQAATGPDRRIDVLLANWDEGHQWDPEEMTRTYTAKPSDYEEDWYEATSADSWGVPRYTASVDLALELAARRRPARYKCGPIHLEYAGSGQCFFEDGDPCGGMIGGFGHTLPLAICVALLKSLAAETSEHPTPAPSDAVMGGLQAKTEGGG